jgi:hypothetical protein
MYLDTEWNEDTWTCIEDSAKTAFRRMMTLGHHRPNPLRVFDIDGNVIAPSEWRSRLPGAEVHAKISISHQFYNGQHNFYADFVEIRVLHNARPVVAIPRVHAKAPPSDGFAAGSKRAAKDQLTPGTSAKQAKKN